MKPLQIIHGDCREILPTLETESVNCCVTSPPYWGLRDYGVSGQLGLELTPDSYISEMVGVFREVRRVLRSDGTLWLNMGDSYATGAGSGRSMGGDSFGKQNQVIDNGGYPECRPNRMPIPGLKPKDLCGIPWMLAFALRADGWYLRSDIIWHKPNPMPESVTDRPTKSHEYLFLLTKSERYYYDFEAIREDAIGETAKMPDGWDTGEGSHGSFHRNGREAGAPAPILPANYKGSLPGRNGGPGQERRSLKDRGRDAAGLMPGSRMGRAPGWRKDAPDAPMRNKRSVWTVATQAMPEAHFATFPEDLIKPCILAGCPAGGTVLDPFYGAGTTGLVARALGCKVVGIELSADYLEIAAKRLSQEVFTFEASI